jgi:peptidyl-prolyl cis-trans isomerase SurA
MVVDYRTFVVAIFLAFLPGHLNAQEERVLDEIVAKINQDTITYTDLNRELRILRISLQDQVQDPSQLEGAFERQKKALLRTLIQNRVMLQKADELGLTSSADAEVDAALDRQRQQMGIPNMEVLDQALQQRGTSLQEYRKNFKDRMVMEWLIQQSVYSRLTLLTPEIEEFYQENQDQFAEPAQVELAEILFLTEGKDKAQVMARAEQALEKLRSGMPFEQVAREDSEGPTAAQGGAIGKFREGSLAEEVEAAVFAVESGEVTGIIETDYGVQILKVLSKDARSVKPLEEVRGLIQNTLYQRKAEPELKAFMDDLLQQSFIYINPKYQLEYDVEGL